MSGEEPFSGPPEDAPDFIKDEYEFLREHDDGTFYPEDAAERDMAHAGTDVEGVFSADDYTPDEEAFHTLYEEVLFPPVEETATRELFGVLATVPRAVRENIEAALRAGALFEAFETLTASDRETLQDYLLAQTQDALGWTVRGLANELRSINPELTQYEAERISRTETQAIVTQARERWYEADFPDEVPLFVWEGPQDGRTTDACTWLKRQTNPAFGGEPVSLEEMKELVEEASETYFPDLEPREWTIHPHERHTIVRVGFQ